MSHNLKLLDDYCVLNRLTINSTKTKYVVFDTPHSKNLNVKLNLSIRGTPLQGVDFYDYLGVRLDNSLSFKPQIARTVSGCNARLFTLSKIRQFIPESVAILIYKTLILSKLTYGGIVCWSAISKELDKLQKAQNRAPRICFKAMRYTSNLSLHQKAKLQPLCLRRKREICKIMYKKTRVQLPNGIDLNIDRPPTRYNTSFPANFVRPYTTRFVKSLTYQGPMIWDSLPNNVKTCDSIEVFMCEVKKLLACEMDSLTYI